MKRIVYVFLSVIMALATTIAAPQTRASIGDGGNLSFQDTPNRQPILKRRDSDSYPTNNLDRRVAELSDQISSEMTENRKRTIAVVEFVDLKGNVTDFGRFLSEELITRLFQTKKFTVIERQMLNKVIAEQKLTLTGTFDQSSARQLGRLLGVDAICSGTVGDLGQSLKVNARLISTETGAIFAVASTEISKDDSVLKLMGGGNNQSDSKKADPAQVSPPLSQKVQTRFFTFELRQCRMSGASVACDILITNNDQDREMELYGGMLYDEIGNNYRSTGRQLGNNIARQLLVSGVPTWAKVTFEDVSNRANKIALLKIGGIVLDGSGDFIVDFRNVALTR